MQAGQEHSVEVALITAVVAVTGGFALALRRRARDLELLNAETVHAFVRAVDALDPYTARHSENVAGYAVELAEYLGIPSAERDPIRWAALLHDIGKLGVPSRLLRKTEPLTGEEWEIIKRHPLESARILDGISHYRDYVPIVRHHHERFDGLGYPDGLAGHAIPFGARVLAIADAFDAMTSDRTYRRAMSEHDALQRVTEVAGSQFDPELSRAFVRMRLGVDLAPRPGRRRLGGSLGRAPLVRGPFERARAASL